MTKEEKKYNIFPKVYILFMEFQKHKCFKKHLFELVHLAVPTQNELIIVKQIFPKNGLIWFQRKQNIKFQSVLSFYITLILISNT